MRESWLRLVLTASVCCFAIPACEDNPDQFYKRAPAGAGDRWNNGETPPTNDKDVRNGFNDNFNATSKQELCSGPVKQKRWAQMVKEPVKPPRMIAGIDLAGGDSWTGLDFRDAEKVLCQSKSLGGDETTLTASWGDADEVTVSYKLSNNTIEQFQLNQGFRGTLDFASRPDASSTGGRNRFGQHKYTVGVGVPILRDGKTYEINWKQVCDAAHPLDCFESQATEMFDALMYTFAPEMTSTQDSCIKAQTCLAKSYSTGEAIFGVRPLGIYMFVPSWLVPQPAASTPSYMYGFYVKLMPFSASEMFLKLDEEGPVSIARDLGDREPKVTCRQTLGMKYGEFLDKCVNVNKDLGTNDYTKGKLLGGMSHDKEAFDFSIEGVNLDFLSSAIGTEKTVGDDWMPQADDEAYEFNMDIRASGNVANEYEGNDTTKTMNFGGTGAIYREYIRRVQDDIHTKMREWPQSTREARQNQCDGGWELVDGKCKYKGYEIGAPECLLPAGGDASTWKPAPGCTGFEQFVSPASPTEGGTEGMRKMSLGAAAIGAGFKTALKAGDPIALFCVDPPNFDHCGDGGDSLGLRGSLLDGSWQRVLQYLGGDNPLNVPPALRDRKYYFKHWAWALVKYLKAASLAPTDLNALSNTACGGFSCDPEPDHLLFDQIGDSGDSDKFEYIDRRFVTHDREPLKIEYQILINSSNQQEWKFHRKLVRAERSLYLAMSENRQEPPAGAHDNVRITNLVGSPILASVGWAGVNDTKDAWYCASTLIDGKPDPECEAIGSVPPRDSTKGGGFMLDDEDGRPVLANYRGAFTGTPFTMGSTHMHLAETLPYIKSAKVNVPLFENPYKIPATAAQGASATPAPIVLVDWRPKTPANGIRIPVNAQRDKFIPSATLNFSGSSLDFDIDYELLPGDTVKIQGIQSDNYQGKLFLCADPVTGDLLEIEQYESTDEIMQWRIQHPGAFDACEIIVRPSAGNPAIPTLLVAKSAGIVLNVGLGSGVGRITSVEFFDTSLL